MTALTRPAAMVAAPHLAAVPDPTPVVFDVVPIIEDERDGLRHEVRLTLTDVQWRQLVGDIAARVLTLRGQGRPVLTKLLAAGHRPSGTVQQDALTELVQMLAGPTHRGSAHTLPPMWDLSPEDAGALVLALSEASDDPVFCPCGAVVQQPTQLTNTCGGCVDQLGGNR